MDYRIKPIKRQFIISIIDNIPIQFSDKDLEEIGEQFEYIMQQKYDFVVNLIEVKDIKNG